MQCCVTDQPDKCLSSAMHSVIMQIKFIVTNNVEIVHIFCIFFVNILVLLPSEEIFVPKM